MPSARGQPVWSLGRSGSTPALRSGTGRPGRLMCAPCVRSVPHGRRRRVATSGSRLTPSRSTVRSVWSPGSSTIWCVSSTETGPGLDGVATRPARAQHGERPVQSAHSRPPGPRAGGCRDHLGRPARRAAGREVRREPRPDRGGVRRGGVGIPGLQGRVARAAGQRAVADGIPARDAVVPGRPGRAPPALPGSRRDRRGGPGRGPRRRASGQCDVALRVDWCLVVDLDQPIGRTTPIRALRDVS